MSQSLDEKLLCYQHALRLFVERLEQDKTILAAVLVGSLTEETIWRKEQISLWVIEV